MDSEEHKLWTAIHEVRKGVKGEHELKGMEKGTEDIVDDWQPILSNLHKIVEILKVPGRKAKCKLQLSNH